MVVGKPNRHYLRGRQDMNREALDIIDNFIHCTSHYPDCADPVNCYQAKLCEMRNTVSGLRGK